MSNTYGTTGMTTMQVNATQQMWEFFQQFQL